MRASFSQQVIAGSASVLKKQPHPDKRCVCVIVPSGSSRFWQCDSYLSYADKLERDGEVRVRLLPAGLSSICLRKYFKYFPESGK